MILDDDLLYNQLLELHKVQNKPRHWKWSAEFIFEDTVIEVFNLVSIDIKSNYVEKVSDYIFIRLQVNRNIYLKLLGLNSNKLKLRLSRSLNNTLGDTDKVSQTFVETYNAFITDNASPNIETSSGGDSGNTTDDMVNWVEIDVQLVEKGISEFRLIEIGGVYRNVIIDDIIRGLLTHPIKELSNSNDTGYDVDMIPSSNTKRYFQMVVPNGIRLIDLPRFIQKKYGVYGSDIGYYLVNGMWYIYPLYDFTRFGNSKRRLTILNLSPNEMSGSDNTYIQEGKDTFIFSTGDTKHIDDSTRNIVNNGSGFRHAKMGNLLDGFSKNTNGKSSIPSGRNSVEISLDVRDGGLSNLKTSNKRLSSNPWLEASNISRGLGAVVFLNWEASNHNLVYPGMPIKLLYKKQGKISSIFGTLLGIQTSSQTSRKTDIDNRYVSSSILTIHIASDTI